VPQHRGRLSTQLSPAGVVALRYFPRPARLVLWAGGKDGPFRTGRKAQSVRRSARLSSVSGKFQTEFLRTAKGAAGETRAIKLVFKVTAWTLGFQTNNNNT